MTRRFARSTAGPNSAWDPTAVGLGALFAVLVGVSLWTGVVAHAVQFLLRWYPGGPPGSLILASAGATLFGVGLGAVAYARYRGLDLRWSRPRRGTWTAGVATVLAPAGLVAAASLVGNAVFGVPLSGMVQQWVSPEASTTLLLGVTLPTAAAVGVGYGLLLCGVVPERIRDLVGPDATVPVAVAVVGFFRLLPVDLFRGLRLGVGGTVETGLSLVFGVAFAASLGVLYRRQSGDGGVVATLRRLDRRHLAVVAVAAVGVVGVATELTELPRAAGDLLWVAALGIAVVGYDRTRSLWVPVLALAAFDAAVTGVVYAEALYGLATI